MSPGLEHFIDEEVDDEQKDSQNTESGNTETNINFDWSNHGLDVDHNAEKNICPACMTPGGKSGTRCWECPNDDCGVLEYFAGWFEKKRTLWDNGSDFLYSIDWVELMEEVNQ